MEDVMSELTRLGFVKSSMAAAAGVTTLGGVVASHAEADQGPVGSEPVVELRRDLGDGG
jgi:hypothetical protein